jgi:hypothetical protein
MPAANYSVITADVVDSRLVEGFREKRDAKLAEVTRLHTDSALVSTPYTITAWDEFQVVLTRPEFTARAILDLRRIFFPMELWIAVGIGSATGLDLGPVNVNAGGEAFERAREAADRLKTVSPKSRALTSFESGNEIFDAIANTIYELHDALLEGRTEKQWEAINMQMEAGRQDITADRLDRDASTISRNLKRAFHWQSLDTVNAMEKIIRAYF